MTLRRILLMGLLALMLVAFVGCAPAAEEPEATEQPTTEAPAENVELVGTTWACYEFSVSGEPQTVLESAPITAEFTADGKMAGKASVNQYSTTYEVDGETMKIAGDIVATKMAGPDDAMTQESNYLTSLPTVASYNIRGDELVLFGPADNMIARYRPQQ